VAKHQPKKTSAVIEDKVIEIKRSPALAKYSWLQWLCGGEIRGKHIGVANFRLIDEYLMYTSEWKAHRVEVPVDIIIAARCEQIQGRYSNIFT